MCTFNYDARVACQKSDFRCKNDAMQPIFCVCVCAGPEQRSRTVQSLGGQLAALVGPAFRCPPRIVECMESRSDIVPPLRIVRSTVDYRMHTNM